MKNFLGINWRVRFSNPISIGQVIVSIFLPVLIYLGIDWQSLTSWHALGVAILDILGNPVALVLIIINFFTTMVDGTSTGISDSRTVKQYDKANNSK